LGQVPEGPLQEEYGEGGRGDAGNFPKQELIIEHNLPEKQS